MCGVCVSLRGQGRCQRWACHSPRGVGGLGTRGTRDSSLIPRPPLAQSVVLETGPQPTPGTAVFAPTPASLQRASHHRSCQAEEPVCQPWSGGGRARTLNPLQPSPPPPSETAEQLRLWPLPHPQSSPSATASSPLLPPPHHWHVCELLAPLLFARLLFGFLLSVGVRDVAPSSPRPIF